MFFFFLFRNARERNRVKQVNGGFDMLKSHIPSAAKHKKLSKVTNAMATNLEIFSKRGIFSFSGGDTEARRGVHPDPAEDAERGQVRL